MTESSPSDDWDEPEPERVGDDEPVEEARPEKTWECLHMVSWYDGPHVFVARRTTDPTPLLFRWAGGTSDDRLYESDCHSAMKQPIYLKNDNVDWKVDTPHKV